MTDRDELAKEAMAAVFSEAQCNALLYGVGFIRISLLKGGRMEFSSVDREEFMETAEHLQWLDKHAMRETKQ